MKWPKNRVSLILSLKMCYLILSLFSSQISSKFIHKSEIIITIHKQITNYKH